MEAAIALQRRTHDMRCQIAAQECFSGTANTVRDSLAVTGPPMITTGKELTQQGRCNCRKNLTYDAGISEI